LTDRSNYHFDTLQSSFDAGKSGQGISNHNFLDVFVPRATVFHGLQFSQQKGLQICHFCLFLLNKFLHKANLLLVVIMFFLEC
jgi:hypothetical protein